MFIKIAEEQMKYFELDVTALIHKGNNIAEFCYTPILDKSFKISEYEKHKIKKIIKRVEKIVKTLEEVKETLDMKTYDKYLNNKKST